MPSLPIPLLWTLFGYPMDSCGNFSNTVRKLHLIGSYFKLLTHLYG